MTSGKFATIPLSSIVVERETRQRRELTGIEELASSIRDHGLINPIVVDRNHILIAGYRPASACGCCQRLVDGQHLVSINAIREHLRGQPYEAVNCLFVGVVDKCAERRCIAYRWNDMVMFGQTGIPSFSANISSASVPSITSQP